MTERKGRNEAEDKLPCSSWANEAKGSDFDELPEVWPESGYCSARCVLLPVLVLPLRLGLLATARALSLYKVRRPNNLECFAVVRLMLHLWPSDSA